MALVLAIQPDFEQACALREALRASVNAQVVVVDSKEAALTVIDKHVPDVVLVHALMSPGDEDHLAACLHTLDGADHVQTIRIPTLDRTRRQRRLRLAALRRRRKPIAARCDLRLFASDVVDYLARARAHRKEIEHKRVVQPQSTSERRCAHRWSPLEVPWVASVRLSAGERADLVDISSGGVLLRSHERPQLASLRDYGHDWPRPGLLLNLTSGEEIRLAGQIVRCRARPVDQRLGRFEVALRFNESVHLFLPPRLDRDLTNRDFNDLSLATPPALLEVVNEWCQW